MNRLRHLVLVLSVLLTLSSCVRDSCQGIDCGAGGTCEAGYCSCEPGWYGTFCELNDDRQAGNANQRPGTVSGTVNPASAVGSVQLQGNSGVFTLPVAADGRFTFNAVYPGTYKLSAISATPLFTAPPHRVVTVSDGQNIVAEPMTMIQNPGAQTGSIQLDIQGGTGQWFGPGDLVSWMADGYLHFGGNDTGGSGYRLFITMQQPKRTGTYAGDTVGLDFRLVYVPANGAGPSSWKSAAGALQEVVITTLGGAGRRISGSFQAQMFGDRWNPKISGTFSQVVF